MNKLEEEDIKALLEKILKPQYIDKWLDKPNPGLNNTTPRLAIENGQSDKVREMLLQVIHGIHI